MAARSTPGWETPNLSWSNINKWKIRVRAKFGGLVHPMLGHIKSELEQHFKRTKVELEPNLAAWSTPG